MESTSSLPSDSDISPQLRPLGTSPPHAGCFRAKVRDCPCVSASPGLLSRTARGAAAPPRSPAGLCLEARAGWPHLLPVGQVPRKLAISGVLCDASRRHTSFAVPQPSCSPPYCTRHRAAEGPRWRRERRFSPQIFCSPHCTSACFSPLGTGSLGDQLARKG